MYIKNIWRYPVKTMGGEPLEHARIGPLGIEGDRIVHVERADGHVITARTHPGFLLHHATLDPNGRPLVDDGAWDSASVARDVERIGGHGAKLVADEGPERFDVLPLLVTTDGSIAAFGEDYRRLRPNIVIGGADGLIERTWEGGYLRLGSVVIGVQDLRLRCIMTSFHPDTGQQNKFITQDIYKRFEGKLALNCYVVQGGRIAVGDSVEFSEHYDTDSPCSSASSADTSPNLAPVLQS
jgi:uncharacterized protein YcbX